jgi:hypothetical protein
MVLAIVDCDCTINKQIHNFLTKKSIENYLEISIPGGAAGLI